MNTRQAFCCFNPDFISFPTGVRGKIQTTANLSVTSHKIAEKFTCGENSFSRSYMRVRWSGSSSGRAAGYQVRGPRFESQSGPSHFFFVLLCPPSTKWVDRSFKIRRK
ncbi:hypothetical protein PoB_000732900 [Plakobranchus ocellatus]|uniref:Uncharacterized protein n=1 Tax=Plakobranchus ocellatus TaxID=259542 RepID=A0AAV3YEW8_9GAST|nr:hypothetical protein PoB_000732900 [Plakobranchus ocellatus]